MNELKTKTLKNLFWNYGTFVLNKFVTFVSTIVLAWLLSPDDFGLLGIAILVLEYLEKLSRFGIEAAVIYHKGDINKTANTAFTLSMFTGTVLTIVTFLSAPWIAAFFNEPRVVPIVQVLALSLIITNMGSIHQARLTKELNFKKQVGPETMKAVIKGVVSIIMALMGFGVWSLVWGRMVSQICSTISYWYIVRWKPGFEFDTALARSLLSYGFQIFLIGLQATIFNNLDYLVIGHQMGSEQLGYYTLAFRLPELFIIGIVIIAGQTLFPTYVAAAQKDITLLREGLLTVIKYVSAITMPLGIGMALIASDFVLLVYSDKWASAIAPAQILSIYAIVYALTYNSGDVFKAMGRPDVINKLAFVRVIILIPILLYAAQFSITHVAWAQLGSNILIMFITFGIMMHMIGLSVKELAQAIRPSLISGLCMLLGTLVVQMLLEGLPIWLDMSIVIFIAALLYMLCLSIFGSELFASVLFMLKKLAVKSGLTG